MNNIEWTYYKARLSSVDGRFRSPIVVGLVKNNADNTVIWKQPKGSSPVVPVGGRAAEAKRYIDRDDCRVNGLNADASFRGRE